MGGDPAAVYCTFRYGTDPTVEWEWKSCKTILKLVPGTGLTSALTPQLLHALTGLDPDTIIISKQLQQTLSDHHTVEVLNFTTLGIIPIISTPTVSELVAMMQH